METPLSTIITCSLFSWIWHRQLLMGLVIFVLVSQQSPALSAPPLEITNSDTRMRTGIKGEMYTEEFTAIGGSGKYEWEQQKLPAELSFGKHTGIVRGIPNTPFTDKEIEISVKDKGDATNIASQKFVFSVMNTKAERDTATNSACYFDRGEKGYTGDLGANISAGPTITTQLIRYNFATEKASFNAQGIGIGAAFRYYASNDISPAPGSTDRDIRRVKSECRANTLTTFEGDQSKYKASAWISLSPVVFASIEEGSNGTSENLSVQPAIVVGLLRDLFNIGVGWNMAGQNRGQVFLLMGIGTGFKF